MAAIVLQLQSGIIVTVTKWPIEPKILTIWPFIEVCLCFKLSQLKDEGDKPKVLKPISSRLAGARKLVTGRTRI